MKKEFLESILRDLPVGEKVKYIGPSAYLFEKEGYKIESNSSHMKVLIKGKVYRLKHYNLTCP